MQKEKMSFRKKLENYWYYYKIHTFVAIFILIVVAITVQQCATKVNPDMTVLVATQQPLLTQDNQDRLQKYLESLTGDVNKDGKKAVQVDVLYFNDSQTMQAMQAKLTIDLMPENKVYLFITDDTTFQQLQKESVFAKLSDAVPGAKGTDDYRLSAAQTALGSAAYQNATKDLSISVKAYKGTQAGDKKYAKDLNNALQVAAKLAASKPAS